MFSSVGRGIRLDEADLNIVDSDAFAASSYALDK